MTSLVLAIVNIYLINYTHAPWWLLVFIIAGVLCDLCRAIVDVGGEDNGKDRE